MGVPRKLPGHARIALRSRGTAWARPKGSVVTLKRPQVIPKLYKFGHNLWPFCSLDRSVPSACLSVIRFIYIYIYIYVTITTGLGPLIVVMGTTQHGTPGHLVLQVCNIYIYIYKNKKTDRRLGRIYRAKNRISVAPSLANFFKYKEESFSPPPLS